MALEITDSNVKEVLGKGKPVVIDFGLHGVDLVKWLDLLLMS